MEDLLETLLKIKETDSWYNHYKGNRITDINDYIKSLLGRNLSIYGIETLNINKDLNQIEVVCKELSLILKSDCGVITYNEFKDNKHYFTFPLGVNFLTNNDNNYEVERLIGNYLLERLQNHSIFEDETPLIVKIELEGDFAVKFEDVLNKICKFNVEDNVYTITESREKVYRLLTLLDYVGSIGSGTEFFNEFFDGDGEDYINIEYKSTNIRELTHSFFESIYDNESFYFGEDTTPYILNSKLTRQ